MDFHKDLIILQGWEVIILEGECGGRAGELGEVGGFVGQDPLLDFGWGGHGEGCGGRLKCLGNSL